MLKGSCPINHEKAYIMYVDSLYKISATDSHSHEDIDNCEL